MIVILLYSETDLGPPVTHSQAQQRFLAEEHEPKKKKNRPIRVVHLRNKNNWLLSTP